jgi:sigma-B regulation protein RsbU (phosphoserine phosphatase)
MIIDDAALNLKILSESLKDEYEVTIFRSGEEALGVVGGIRPDLILLDVLMPGMDGYEVCRRLKADEKTRSIPIIFLTALTEEMEETRGLALGAVDYITKPISIPILLLRIKTQLQLLEQNQKLAETIRENQRRTVQQKPIPTAPETELNLARAIQGNFLTPAPPISQLFQAHVYYQPRRAVGGDFYDFVERRETDVGFFIGDTGLTGTSAAMTEVLFREFFREYHKTSASPGVLLQTLNNAIHGKLDEFYISGFYGLLSQENRRFTFANAGNPATLIYHAAEGRVEKLTQGGLPLGTIKAEIPYPTGTVDLDPGDRVLMYTDGLIEGIGDEPLAGVGSLAESLARHAGRSLKEMVKLLTEEMEDLCETSGRYRDDDVTVLAVEIL